MILHSKNLSLHIIEKLQYFDEAKANDMIDCGRVLTFDKQLHQVDFSTRLKLGNVHLQV